MTLAKAGERVMDSETGKVICRLKNDIEHYGIVSAHDFHEFSEDEIPWETGQICDPRCIKTYDEGGVSIFVEGSWRP